MHITSTRRRLTWILWPALLTATAAYAGVSGPDFSKVFTPDTIGPGSVSTLRFDIVNNDNFVVTDLAFTDGLPAGVIIADPGNAFTDCPNGIVGAPDGGTTITFSDGDVGALGSCIVTVDVTSSTPGTHMNVSGFLTSSAGAGDVAVDDLTVTTSLPGFSKSFAPSTVPLGDRSTLTLTIDNMANASKVLNLDFIDNLPVGMEIADPADASTTCGTATVPPTLTATAGTSVIVLDANGTAAFPALAAGATCTVTVDVVATGDGELDNVTELLAEFVSAGQASATLEVTVTTIALLKSFTDDPVPPGGTVTLDFRVDNFDRDFSATGVTFTDDLALALSGLTFSSLLSSDCGGSVTGVGTTTITLTGGTVPAQSFCTISASLTVPSAAEPGSYTNTTGAISGTVAGSPVTGNMATETLYVEPFPILTKEFVGDPVDPGDTVTLRFTITNTSTTSGATDIEFDDELTDGSGGVPPDPTSGFLPFPVSVTLPPVPDPPCGGGSTLALVSAGTDRQALRLTGGSLAAAGSCTFDVTVEIPATFAPGVYTNTTEEITATIDTCMDGCFETFTGAPASDDLAVIAAPQLSKAFTDDPVAPGGTVTLEFTLSHSAGSPTDATGITFTDDLATVLTGLTANLPPTPDPPCGAGSTLTGSAGDTLLTLMDGTLMPGEDCTFSVTLDVPAGAASGSYTNTTSGVGATVGGLPTTSAPASDDLDVAGLVFTKEFLGDPVIAGDTLTLRFTIANVDPTDDATITSFTDSLSSALPGLAATGAPSVNTCGGTLSGTTFLSYSGGSVMAGQSCTIEVEVLVPVGAADGTYTNTTSFLTANQGGTVFVDPAIDALTVTSNLIQLTKEFTDDPVPPGDSVTLELTLTNLDGGQPASDIDFTDDLTTTGLGLTFDSVLANDCGATVSGTGTSMITVTGASLGIGGTCTIRLSLTVPGGAAANVYTNTTSAVTGTIGGFAVNGDAASDELEVRNLLLFSKAFDGPTTATGSARLTFTITNPNPTTASDLFFSDDLDDVVPGLVATSLPTDPCGTGSTLTGTSFLAFNGGTLPPSGGMCSFFVDVSVPGTATAGTFPNTTSELFQAGLSVADPATADLIIEPPPLFSKSFSPNPILAGTVSTLSFTIDNTDSALAASALDFTDKLPAGMVIAPAPDASTTCTGGTLTAVAGTGTFSYTGGTVGAGAACTAEVDVTASPEGTYVNISGDLTSSSGSSGTAGDTLSVIESMPPAVTAVATAAGALATCDTVRLPLASIQVTIADDQSPVVGADDPGNYLVVAAGPNGAFDTGACGSAMGDDVPVEIVSLSLASVDPVTVTASLQFGAVLDPGLYRLLVCDTIVDGAGNQLDGDDDGNAGGDFVLPFFRADPANLFANGNFDDCPVTLDPWVPMTTAPNLVQTGLAGADDVDGSPLSASARFFHSAAGPSALGQCVPVTGGLDYSFRSRVRFVSPTGALALFAPSCELFAGADCSGASLGAPPTTVSLLEDEGGAWILVSGAVGAPAAAVSALCDFAAQALGGDGDFDLFLDGLFLGEDAAIFTDGFESGDTSKWSSTVP